MISGACAALIAALFVVPHLGTEFIPIMDEGAFDMDVQLLPGISLDKALDITNLVEKKLKQFPELTTIISRTGQTGIALEARGVDKTGFTGNPETAIGVENGVRSGWTDRKDEGCCLQNPRDGFQLQPAHPMPHRRACGRNTGTADRETLRR